MWTDPMIHYVCQTQPDGTCKVLYETPDPKVAEREVDRINTHLQNAGIPSSVSCAFMM